MAALGLALLGLSRSYRRQATEIRQRDGDPDRFWASTTSAHRYVVGPLSLGMITFGLAVFVYRLVT